MHAGPQHQFSESRDRRLNPHAVEGVPREDGDPAHATYVYGAELVLRTLYEHDPDVQDFGTHPVFHRCRRCTQYQPADSRRGSVEPPFLGEGGPPDHARQCRVGPGGSPDYLEPRWYVHHLGEAHDQEEDVSHEEGVRSDLVDVLSVCGCFPSRRLAVHVDADCRREDVPRDPPCFLREHHEVAEGPHRRVFALRRESMVPSAEFGIGGSVRWAPVAPRHPGANPEGDPWIPGVVLRDGFALAEPAEGEPHVLAASDRLSDAEEASHALEPEHFAPCVLGCVQQVGGRCHDIDFANCGLIDEADRPPAVPPPLEVPELVVERSVGFLRDPVGVDRQRGAHPPCHELVAQFGVRACVHRGVRLVGHGVTSTRPSNEHDGQWLLRGHPCSHVCKRTVASVEHEPLRAPLVRSPSKNNDRVIN